VSSATDEALELAGITALADTQAALLTTGQRRLVELARVLAGTFTMVMLDEPSAGLDSEETGRFGEMLHHVVAERGIGILLVEHDMSLVRHVCSDIYVLDFGRLIFNGTPDEMISSDLVRAAYLGSDSVVSELGADVEAEEAGDLV
jgi:ABC-type branched-subunit amino acid transport system ATPase component